MVRVKYKKGKTITKVFQKKIAAKHAGYLDKFMDKNLKENDIELYLTHNVDKSVISERFSRTLRNKINKYMTDTAKNVYIDEI